MKLALALLLPFVLAAPTADPATPATTSGQQPIPRGGNYKCTAEPLFSDLSTTYTREFLKTLTNFTNRASYSEHGVASQAWLRSQIEAVRTLCPYPPLLPSPHDSASLP